VKYVYIIEIYIDVQNSLEKFPIMENIKGD